MVRVFPLLTLLACEQAAPIMLVGQWSDPFGTTHEISRDRWVQTFAPGVAAAFEIARWDDDEQWLVAQNGADNDYFPGLWSRFDWTEDAATVYVCQTTFDAPSEDDALNTPPADPSDPKTGGCGGFAWTELSPL